MAAAPDEQTGPWVEMAEQQAIDALPDALAAELLVVLHQRVADRVPDWRRAYALSTKLLASLELASRSQPGAS